MGLAERRAIVEFQNSKFPEIKEKLNKTAGFEVNIEIDWDSIMDDEGSAELFEESLPKVYFTPLIQAIKQICIDDIGKEALQKGLKKVIISNLTGNSNEDNFTFVYGTLKIDHQPCCNIDYIAERTQAIKALLENGL